MTAEQMIPFIGGIFSLLMALLAFFLSAWHRSVEARFENAEKGAQEVRDRVARLEASVPSLLGNTQLLREEVRDLKAASERFHEWLFTVMKAPPNVGPYPGDVSQKGRSDAEK